MASLVIALSLTLVSQVAGDKSAESRFLKEYPPAAAKLEARLSQAKGIAKIYNPSEKKGEDVGVPILFAVDGPLRKFEYSTRRGKGKEAQTFRFVYCMAGPKSFQLESQGEGRSYSVQRVGLDLLDKAAFKTLFGKYLEAPWAISGARLTEWIGYADFRLKAARELESDLGRVVEVEFDSGSFKGVPESHRIRLAPGLGWAIVSSEYRSGLTHKKAETLDVDYSLDPSGGPTFPKRVRWKGRDGVEQICVFERVEFAPTPVGEFGMEHYGLKDMTQYASSKSSSLYWWVILSAVVVALLAGSLALKKAADRRR